MKSVADKQRKILLEIKNEISTNNNGIFFDVNWPPNTDKNPVTNFIWIGTEKKIIGHINCHYEFIFQTDNPNFLTTEVHLDERGHQDLYKNLILGESLEFKKWYGENGRIVFKGNGININDENIVKKAIEQLSYIHEKIGKQLIEILLSNIKFLPKSAQSLKPTLASGHGSVITRKHYKEITKREAKSLDTFHGLIQSRLINELSSLNKYESIEEEKGFIGFPYRIDVLAKLKSVDAYDVFEVKPNSTATDCIKEAFGQILFYEHLLEQGGYKINELVIVGPENIKDREMGYLQKIQKLVPKLKYISS